MNVWQKGMNPIQTPDNIPRLFDMVKVMDEHIRPAFYFALRDTLVADDLDQATRVAFQKDKRWRVVTLQGQIIEQSGKVFKCVYGFHDVFLTLLLLLMADPIKSIQKLKENSL